MNILGTINRCIVMIPKELIEGLILYVELDKDSYEIIQDEIKAVAGSNITLDEQKIADIGKGLVVNFAEGYKVVVVKNSGKDKMDNFYIAFKTKVI